jgi:hypothetical protein
MTNKKSSADKVLTINVSKDDGKQHEDNFQIWYRDCHYRESI